MRCKSIHLGRHSDDRTVQCIFRAPAEPSDKAIFGPIYYLARSTDFDCHFLRRVAETALNKVLSIPHLYTKSRRRMPGRATAVIPVSGHEPSWSAKVAGVHLYELTGLGRRVAGAL